MSSINSLFLCRPRPAATILQRGLPFLLLVLLPIFFGASPACGEKSVTQPFSIAELIQRAEELAARPYQEPPKVMVKLLGLSYDAWRDIRFQPEKSLWRGQGLPFELQFFHPGFYYDRTVRINIVENGQVSPLKGVRDMFDYGPNAATVKLPEEVGFAGFRVHGPINTPQYFDEIVVFLGASYLRALGRNHHYGLSARGLTVDTAAPQGEEFPWFREFWIVKPSPKSRFLDIHALLDSQRITGAFSYRIYPGEKTILKVKSTLFPRQVIDKVGIGPLTSMFFLGENSSPRRFDDFRPEVHDSDGLQILFNNGEWLWRPLQNPVNLQVNSFEAPDVRGFGLIQRDRDFGSYQDLEARYEKRPSVWVVPRGNWGAGRVQLVQIPTQDEIHDNIVAFWVPDKQPTPGKALELEYEMRWLDADRILPPRDHVITTRTGIDPVRKTRVFVIEFDGRSLRRLSDRAPVEADIWAGEGGKIVDVQTFRNPVTRTWRLAFQIEVEKTNTLEQMLPNKRPLIELRAALKLGDKVLSETWSYAFKP
ncbi:MAG: glucan biosynthesis protein G [Deltaproteobacteria bacterium]|nr:glucan biosynthesis protein G [Deltaproteobacteria bacterium]